MKKLIAVLLCAALVGSLSACNHTNNDNPNGNNTVNNTDENNQNSSQDEESDDMDKTQLSALEEAESMMPVFEAMITTDSLTGLEYGVWNTDFMWTACNMLMCAMASDDIMGQITSSQVTASSEEVKACINAMFAGFDGNKQGLPEVSGNLVTYNETKDTYAFEVGDYGAQYIKIASCDISDQTETITVHVNLYYDGENTPEASYKFEMEPSTYAGASAEAFSYMIVSFEKDASSSDNELEEGMITEDKALTLAEQIYGKNGQPDADTGNIITYGLEGMETLNGKNYYNFRMSWMVINEEGLADHSSYLCNIFVCVDGSEILEVSRNMDGEWEALED